MSQPTPYTPTTDFSQQEASNASGRSTVNTAALDAEFAAIDVTLDQTLANLQLIQRDDGKLADLTVQLHTLSPEVLNLIGGYALRGLWATSTAYSVNDIVSNGEYTYVCTVAHTSSGSFDDTKFIQFGFTNGTDAAIAAANAQVSANQAAASALAAAASAAAALVSENNSDASEAAALASQIAAAASASNSASSATSSANSAAAAAVSAAAITLPLSIANGGTGNTSSGAALTALGGVSSATLAASSGSNSVGFKQSGIGTVASTVQSELRLSFNVRQFGASPSNTPGQNDTAFAAAAAHALLTSASYDTVTLKVPAGIYEYTTSPNWAIPRLTIECESGTVFKHTGSGNAMVFDGGAAGGGVFVVALKGNPLIMGNASTTNAMYNRAVHNSAFEFRVRDASTSVLKTEWVVCNEYTIRCSPLGEPAFSVIPASGLVLDKRGAGEMTSACTFYNPIIEGLTAGYGIVLNNAVQNTFIGGTSESNGGGVSIAATSSSNTFHNMDCEFNTTIDFFIQGSYNTFVNAYSDTTSTFSGTGNLVVGGTFNTVVSSGTNNEFHRMNYGAAAGSFTDSGTATVKISVRNASGGALDVDLQGNAKSLTRIAGNGGTHDVLIGAANLIIGGSANDTTIYKYGGGLVGIYNGAGYVIQAGSNTLGFFNSMPVAKPNVSGSKGGNAALGSLLTNLASLGLIVDSST